MLETQFVINRVIKRYYCCVVYIICLSFTSKTQKVLSFLLSICSTIFMAGYHLVNLVLNDGVNEHIGMLEIVLPPKVVTK